MVGWEAREIEDTYLLQNFYCFEYLHKNYERPKILIFSQIQTPGL